MSAKGGGGQLSLFSVLLKEVKQRRKGKPTGALCRAVGDGVWLPREAAETSLLPSSKKAQKDGAGNGTGLT